MELKTAIDLPFAPDLEELDLTRRLDTMVIMKERKEKMWGLEEKLKAKEAPEVQREEPHTCGATSFVVVDNYEENEILGSHIVEGRRFSQATTDFAPGFQNVDEGPREVVADTEE